MPYSLFPVIPTPNPMRTPTIYYILKLCNKYELSGIDYCWTPDSMYHGLSRKDTLPDPTSAIQLARQCQVPTLLPAAFYHLSRFSVR
ncbi:hypothetical protein BDR04DRAFT_1093328 [Suillus decipiens]|nr:hypothetical protein BDR04DRAFT_1093328 [Suillus decipiens]